MKNILRTVLVLGWFVFPTLLHGQGTQVVTAAADSGTCRPGMIYFNSILNAIKFCNTSRVWLTIAASGSAAGTPTTSLQFNNAGALGGTGWLYTAASGGLAITSDSAILQITSTDGISSIGIVSGNHNNNGPSFFAQTSGNGDSGGGTGSGAAYQGTSLAKGTNVTATGLKVGVGQESGDSSNGQTYLGVSVAPSGIGAWAGNAVRSLGIAVNPMGNPGGIGTTGTVDGIEIGDQGNKGTTRTSAIHIISQTTCATCYAIKVDGGTVDIAGFFQTNGTPNATQTGFNFANSTGVTGLNCTNVTANTTACSIANPDATPGTKVATITETTPVEGDLVTYNSSGVKINKTPGIPGRVVTNSGTLSGADLVSCTPGSAGDRGRTIIFTNASAVTETLPSPTAANCGSNFYIRMYWQGAAGGTLKATTATLNGTAGATGLPIAGNTWVDAASHDNVNYDVFVSGSGGGSSAFPLTVSGTVTSGGIPYFNSTTQESSSAVQTANVYIRGGGAGGAPTPGLTTDDGTSSTYTGTGGTKSPVYTATGSTAFFSAYTQGPTSAAVAPCNTANTACFQAPAAVTSYVADVPGAAPVNNNSAIVFSNSNPSLGTFAKMPQTAVLSSAYTNATTSATNVTGLSFALEVTTTYTLSCHLIYQAAATGGLNINFTGPGSPTKVTYGLNYFTTATAANSSATTGSTFATVVGGTVIGTAATDFTADLNGAIINGANSGTLQLQAKSNAAVTLTIEAGSSCTLQ